MSARRQTPNLHSARDPWWWLLLSVWVLNDHLWKYDPAVPNFLSGKISDVAGLYVLAAAAISYGGRSPRSSTLACIVLALAFSALQIYPPFAVLAENVLATLNIPSAITPDPTDMLCLGILPLVLQRYTQQKNLAFASMHKNVVPPRFLISAAGLGCMLVATLATSRIPNDERNERSGRLFLHNHSDDIVQIRVAAPGELASIDCFAVGSNPTQMLREALFERSWNLTLEAGELRSLDEFTVNADGAAPESCYALRIESPVLAPTLLFWNVENLPNRQFSRFPDASDVLVQGVVSVDRSPDEMTLEFVHTGENIVYPIEATGPDEIPVECTFAPDEERLAWDPDFPKTPHVLVGLISSPDGCLGLELSEDGTTTETIRRYLCIPPASFPFATGTRLQFRSLEGVAKSVNGTVLGWQISPAQPDPDLEMFISKGAGLPDIHGVQFSLTPSLNCPYTSSDDCGTVARPLGLYASAEGQEAVLTVQGEISAFQLSAPARTVELRLVSGQVRAVVNPACGVGEIIAGPDIELVATIRKGGTAP